MGKLKEELWAINVVDDYGIAANPDIAFGYTQENQPALRLGNNIITKGGGGEPGESDTAVVHFVLTSGGDCSSDVTFDTMKEWIGDGKNVVGLITVDGFLRVLTISPSLESDPNNEICFLSINPETGNDLEELDADTIGATTQTGTDLISYRVVATNTGFNFTKTPLGMLLPNGSVDMLVR